VLEVVDDFDGEPVGRFAEMSGRRWSHFGRSVAAIATEQIVSVELQDAEHLGEDVRPVIFIEDEVSRSRPKHPLPPPSHEAFLDELTTLRRDLMPLTGPVNYPTPTFRYQFGLDASRLEAIAESTVHTWHGEPHVRSIQFK